MNKMIVNEFGKMNVFKIKKILSSILKGATIYCIIVVVEHIISLVKLLFSAYMSKVLFNAIQDILLSGSFKTESINKPLIIMIIAVVFELSIKMILGVLKYYSNKSLMGYKDYCERKFNNALISIPLIKHENAEEKNNTVLIKSYKNSIEIVYNSVVGIAFSLIAIPMVISIILKFNIILIFIIIFSVVPTLIIKKALESVEIKHEKEIIGINRYISYINGIFLDKDSVQDIKTYQAGKLFDTIHFNRTNTRNKMILNKIKDVTNIELISGTINSVIAIVQNITIIFTIIQKNMTIGDFSYYNGIVNGLKGSVDNLVSNIVALIVNQEKAYKYFSFIYDNPENETNTHYKNIMSISSIEFKNVNFKYLNAEKNILNNVNIKINCGENVAVVGANGSGKTTLIKLILKMYRPLDGKIIINGEMDINEIPEKYYYKLLSLCAQNTKPYNISIKDNILMNSEYEIDRFNMIIKQLNIYKALQQKDISLDYGKEFDAYGVQLSKGQSKCLCMARCMYKNASIYMTNLEMA